MLHQQKFYERINIAKYEACTKYIKTPKGKLDQLKIIFLEWLYLIGYNCSGILDEVAFSVLLPKSYTLMGLFYNKVMESGNSNKN